MALLLEWLGLLLRWIHVIAGIMWIGDSLLFMWIDSHLHPDPQKRGDVAGVTWLIHGGGYYHLEKRLLVTGRLPPRLRWFWLEATITWLSGFLLLIVVYYLSADAFMVDRAVSALTPGQAVAVGVGMLVLGWAVYDALWRSPLRREPLPAAIISAVLLMGVIFAATRLLSARAAFLHVGSMLGTIMAANVWVHILPPQYRMVQAARAGREIDYSLGVHAKTRSTHNTYLTFPAIFLMISPHFPTIYAASPNWVVLSLFIVLGAGIRHLMVAGPRGAGGTAVATVASALLLIYLTAGTASPPPVTTGVPAPPFTEVRTIVVRRCTPCHSETPTDPDFTAAAGAVKMDTPSQIRALARRIKVRAVDLRTMPLGNETGMTEEERATLGGWVDAGAPLK